MGRGEPNAKMRAFARYREATRFLLARVFRSWRQIPAEQLQQQQPPPPPPRPPPPPLLLQPSSSLPTGGDQPMAQAANRAKRPVASPSAGGSSARDGPKRVAVPLTGPSPPILLPPALPQNGPEPGWSMQRTSRASSTSLPTVNSVITSAVEAADEEARLARARDEVRRTAVTVAELVSASVNEIWTSMMRAMKEVEKHEKAQGIVRTELDRLRWRQEWLELFVQSKLDDGGTLSGVLR